MQKWAPPLSFQPKDVSLFLVLKSYNLRIFSSLVAAQATKCLPEASEIEVETGPYFGGKIASEKGDCEIEGDPKSPKDVYAMRIDHKSCGSLVSHDDLTVETYITVQENSGILTHSTRRFLVVCTFQPDTLTVRARLALPGKGGASVMEPDDLWQDRRSGRERQFKMVDKSALVLKESEEPEESASQSNENSTENVISISSYSDSPPEPTKKPKKKPTEYQKQPRYSRLSSETNNSSKSFWIFQTNSIIGISIGVALSILVVFVFVFLFKHESRKQRQSRERLTNAYS